MERSSLMENCSVDFSAVSLYPPTVVLLATLIFEIPMPASPSRTASVSRVESSRGTAGRQIRMVKIACVSMASSTG